MTTLIKNAIIIDGSLKPAFKGDVFIRNGTISAIGDLGRQSAVVQINASGCYLSPGFIDVNTSSDHYLTLLTNPKQQDFLLQGVTTIFGGHCGSSLAPLLYGELVSIRKWANDISRVNIDWKTMSEFLSTVQKKGLGLNFGTLVGHSTIRRALIGESLRDLTTNELAVFQKILIKSLEEGAFGFSTGLSYVHSKSTPHHEIERLVDIVSRKGGIYATHLRNETDGLEKSLEETINIARETKAKILINHFRPIKGFEAEYGRCLFNLSQNVSDAQIYFNIYPFDQSHIAIYSLLPDWAKNGGIEIMLQNIKDKKKRVKIISELKLSKDAENITVATAPHLDFLIGKKLKDFSTKRGVSLEEGLVSLMELTQLRCTVFWKNIDYELTKKSLAHERALISSNSESLSPGVFKGERSTSTFTKFLDLVFRENILSIEAAIQKISSTPASLFGLIGRGTIREGMKADISIFSFDDVKGTEIQHVLVNGKHVVKNKELKLDNAGEILRKT